MQALYFVRHGESEDNRDQVWSRHDTPLTNTGRAQALATAKAIQNKQVAFDLVLTSTLPRAIESARIICEHIGYPIHKLEFHELFNERDWGTLAGTPGADFYGKGKTIADIDLAIGTEKLADVQDRAGRSLAYIQTRPEERILLVGHGSFARALRRAINNQPLTDEYAPDLVRFHNAELSRLI